MTGRTKGAFVARDGRGSEETEDGDKGVVMAGDVCRKLAELGRMGGLASSATEATGVSRPSL